MLCACGTSKTLKLYSETPHDSGGKGAVRYKIALEIKGEKNKEALLVMHYGTKKYSIDTAKIDQWGKAVFTGNKPLTPGMYLIASDGNTMFDFLISDTINQTFSVSTTKNKYAETLSFKNSPENEAFADYTRFMLERQKKEKELNDKIKKEGKEKNYNSDTEAQIEALAEQTSLKIREIEVKYPGSLLSAMANAMNPVQPKMSEMSKIPDNDKQRYLYEFLKTHYWDNISLTDFRMQYTPILIPAVDNYFNSVLPQIPDSIMRGVDVVLNKAANDTLMTRMLAGHIFENYIESKIMGMESVVVYIIDNYYLNGKVKINDAKFIGDITDYAYKNRETLVGKKAKNLKMETINGTYESLYDIDSPYTLVYIYEPTCGYCQQETPKVYKVFQNYKNKGLVGFCVYSQSNREEWISYVSKNKLTDWINVWDPANKNNFRIAYSVYSVPQVYLLDKDKKIIGRRLDSNSLSQMLAHLIKDK
jgi:thiol-disulfide isomerase/thioredoxin